MTKVLIDVALLAIACLAGGSIVDSGRRFIVLFGQLRANVSAGMPTHVMRVTTCSTGVATTLGPVPAMAYQPGTSQPGTNVVNNTAGALPVRVRMVRRPAAMRAAA